jgi:excinuclease UvrABC nuclease subunit
MRRSRETGSGQSCVAVGIAKKEELPLHAPTATNRVALASTDPALLLVQRIRDEAHRFASPSIARARSMRDPAIRAGSRRRNRSAPPPHAADHVRQPRRRAPATREELAAVVGPNVADAVLAFFAGQRNGA